MLLNQVLICGTYVLLWLCEFLKKLREELDGKVPYQQTCIGGIKLMLSELQVEDQTASKLREQTLKDGWEEIEGLLHQEDIPYVPEIIRTELISRL